MINFDRLQDIELPSYDDLVKTGDLYSWELYRGGKPFGVVSIRSVPPIDRYMMPTFEITVENVRANFDTVFFCRWQPSTYQKLKTAFVMHIGSIVH